MPSANNPTLNAAAAVDFLVNSLLARRDALRNGLDGPRRDLNAECGYPERIEATDYRQMFDREGIAARVVTIYPRACWKKPPAVYETEDADEETEFEKGVKEVGKSLRGVSWLESQEDQGNPLFHHLQLLDERAGIGRFGIMLIGLDDDDDLSKPVQGFIESAGASTSGAPTRKLLYLRVLDESLVTIDAYETNRKSPRYGQPTMYSVTFSDHSEIGVPLGEGSTITSKVHWHRVIHFADNAGSSVVFGAPRMESVWNRLVDLRKTLGSSGEMFYRGGFPGLGLVMDPVAAAAAGIDVNSEKWLETTREAIANYTHGLDRFLALLGIKPESLATQVSEPTAHIRVQLEAICVSIDVPLRIFLGNELGLKSSEDDREDWNDSVKFRNDNVTTPKIVAPTIDRLISVRVLPQPKQYYVSWPELETPSQMDRAEFAKAVVEMLAKYVGSNVQEALPLIHVFTTLLGMTQEEADAIIEELEAHQAELDAEADAEADAQAALLAEMRARGGLPSPTQDAAGGNGRPRGLPDDNDDRFP